MTGIAGGRFAIITEEIIREFITLTDGIRRNEANMDVWLQQPELNHDAPVDYMATILSHVRTMHGLAVNLEQLCEVQSALACAAADAARIADKVNAKADVIQSELCGRANQNMGSLIKHQRKHD